MGTTKPVFRAMLFTSVVVANLVALKPNKSGNL